MTRPLRIFLIVAAVPVILFAWVSAVFAMDRASNDGEILGRVSIDGVALGGLRADEARQTITDIENRLATEPITIRIQDTTYTLLPRDVGYDIDEETIVADALGHGRDGGFMAELGWWVGHFGGGDHDIRYEPTYNRSALINLLHGWEREAINDPPVEGGIEIRESQIVPIYPASGTGLDYEATADLIEAQVLGETRGSVEAVTEYRIPVVTREQVDLAVERARELVDGPVTLARIIPQTSVTFPAEVLVEALASREVETGLDRDIELFFQLGPLSRFLDPIRELVETEPVEAAVAIRIDDVPIIIPGYPAALIDDAGLPDAVYKAATSVTRTGPLPFREGRAPEFTTDDAEALGIKELLYTATTFYSCCGDIKNQNRVTNIRRIAEEVDGAIVLPGETFSLNEHVGRRTEEDGYRRAGAIIGPVVYCCDHPANVGGGVSQFTTTLYNAIWWSGLEDVDHKPHTLYFSRYPVVREATLGFPSPDLVFRNNTEHAIYLKTESTETSVTVKVFGDNGGIEVEGFTSDRYAFVDPDEWLEPNPDVMPGEKELVDDGEAGFTADVTRVITYPDGTQESQVWTWTYDPHPITYEVHPCELPEDHPQYDETIECPVQVPFLGDLTQAEATAALNALGLQIAIGEPFPVSAESGLAGTVRAQDVPPDTWIEIGETVTVRIGVEIEEEPDTQG
jgi:vancomycin resistance protein YoaR